MAVEETQTMSAAVDAVVDRTGRLDRQADVIGFVRLTIRECEALRFFDKSWQEDQITPTADPYTWTHPAFLRALNYVQYPHLYDAHGEVIEPIHINANRAKRYMHTFYSGPDYSIFRGHRAGDAGVTALIDLGYFSWRTVLRFYSEVADRPARYDLITDAWLYHTDYDTTDELKTTARALVQNWLLRDWFDLIVQGAMSKVFHTFGDDRARPSFAAYKQSQQSLMDGETHRFLNTTSPR